jgi:hypothetical protein
MVEYVLLRGQSRSIRYPFLCALPVLYGPVGHATAGHRVRYHLRYHLRQDGIDVQKTISMRTATAMRIFVRLIEASKSLEQATDGSLDVYINTYEFRAYVPTSRNGTLALYDKYS